MYHNYKNMSETSDQCFSGTSGTPRAGSNPGLLESSTSSSEQQQHKFPGTGAAQFVPSLNTITSSQDLQWLVQPSLLPPPAIPRAPRPPLPPPLGPLSPPQQASQMHLLRPGVIRAAGETGVLRRRTDDFLSPEELERRRMRRERNKLAAAKCRNRRRELTDTLQNETDQLESDKTSLQKEISELEKEKEKLELVLEAHRPICKIEDSDSDSDSDPDPQPFLLGAVKIEREDPDLPGPSIRQDKPKPKIILPSTVPASSSSSASALPAESDSLHTPILISTPSPNTSANLVFTYPSAPLDASAAATAHHLSLLASSSSVPHPCSVAHRRSSSSGDQSSDHSLNSPTILTL
ncbi:fos-related antigen 1a [Paramormyrops kingsleyae]|uniref:FOS like 1, AP-1 transcription factor subunit a n=1 Tax=Paramormyrops kingsleyae TaxID=1676925 RepID=A0A3B3QW27_9TELE|nr:fos-related antigen 1 [Paramormyrops kingsleyae]